VSILAIEAARLSGLPLLIAGIIQDQTYFREQVEPHLGLRRSRYIGPVDVPGKNELLRTAPSAAAPEHHPGVGTIRTGLGRKPMPPVCPVIAMDLGSCVR